MPTQNFSELIANEPLVLVDFYAEWCGPCKMMAPILEEVKTSIGNAARIIKVDVDRNTMAAEEYNISGVPTLILFRQGEIVWRQSGVVAPSQIRQVIQRFAVMN